MKPNITEPKLLGERDMNEARIHPIDQQKMEQFVHRVLGDTSALTTVVLGALGDKLGLFKNLNAQGSASSVELARWAGVQERYAREWLRAMASAGYLTFDSTAQRFTLPPEHAPVLAQETGPVFFGGVWEMLIGMLYPIDKLAQAFKEGGGVAQAEYPDATYHGMDRFTAGWFENLLVQEWLPAVAAVKAALERGIEVADVGCGRGRAVIKFAQAFPKSRVVGYDVYQPNIDRAMANAEAAGVADRVKFERLDASKAMPGQYDLITTFDVIHDAVDPQGLLRTIRRALRPGGTYLCLDVNCSDKPEENTGPLASLFYGFSIVYCMTTSLANGGEGLGTCGLPESKLRELALAAGFSSVRKLPLGNPFNNLYEVKP
jgi:2-polyprenyl-3-methyl-5-hydroxy-6-metoxy-1,4-benzoquinol methylase